VAPLSFPLYVQMYIAGDLWNLQISTQREQLADYSKPAARPAEKQQ